jgi:hypothetical protein
MLLNVYHRKAKREDRRRTTLHEFGHALGLMHEHLHPDSGFNFREDVIVKEMKEFGWCRPDKPDEDCLVKVKQHITEPATPDHACRGAPQYDETSIMHYPIPARWLKGGKATVRNYDLSKGDLNCVQSLYLAEPPPRPPRPPIGSTDCYPPPTCCISRCRRCGSVRQSRIVSWPPLPPRWVREFWDDEWRDDEW